MILRGSLAAACLFTTAAGSSWAGTRTECMAATPFGIETLSINNAAADGGPMGEAIAATQAATHANVWKLHCGT